MKTSSRKTKRKPAGARRRPAATRASGGLANALFSGTQKRLLALLFAQSQRTFFATELIGLIGAGSGAVQRELQRLAASGLVTVTKQGNQKHYQANADSPIFAELQAIVRKTFGLVEPLKQALAAIDSQIELAIVYGSVAKGSDTASSDIDLLIVSDGLTLEQVFEALEPAEQELSRKINPTLYSTEEFSKRRRTDDSFVSKVLAGGHIVLLGDEHAFAPAR
jgi:predicted nucleotidyltransferase